MSLPGRKPRPAALKLLIGDRRGINPHAPRPANAMPTCPAHLKGEARAEWKRIGRELTRMGVISKADRAALACYCQAWARWVDAEQKLAEHGPIVRSPSGFPIQNPYLSVANAAMEQVRRLSAEFGITPSSRSRVSASPQISKSDEKAERFFTQNYAQEQRA